MNLRDTLERLWWTSVAAAIATPLGAEVFDIDVWKAAGVSAFVAAVNFVSVIARARLAVLPDPGAGLPGLPTDRH